MRMSRKRVLRKGDLVLEPLSYSKTVFFIEKGLARMFYCKDAKKITHYFFMEQSFVASSESVFYNKKSIYGIEALEQLVVIEIPYPKIEVMAEQNIEMNKVIQQLLLNMLVSFSNRLNSLQFESAYDRYHYLLENHSSILLRAPLGDIASYLGISQQTLSVIRSQIK